MSPGDASMDLPSYFARIGFAGRARPDLGTLIALHRLHVNAIPFENLDVQLRRKVTLDPEAAFEKLVGRRRGGWCYEQNGLLGCALARIGFEVTRVSAGVMRETGGDAQMGNHLCLLVRLEDETWLADVGFGGSLENPLPLKTIERCDRPYTVGLRRQEDGHWRFADSDAGNLSSFDFRAEPADEARLAAKCEELQTDPASPFVKNLVAQRRLGDTHITLRGRVFAQTGVARKETLRSAGELVQVLRERFALDVPEVADLRTARSPRAALVTATAVTVP
jgi:N-hydroxyarylamine O-acetyltransferase